MAVIQRGEHETEKREIDNSRMATVTSASMERGAWSRTEPTTAEATDGFGIRGDMINQERVRAGSGSGSRITGREGRGPELEQQCSNSLVWTCWATHWRSGRTRWSAPCCVGRQPLLLVLLLFSWRLVRAPPSVPSMNGLGSAELTLDGHDLIAVQ